MEWPLLTHYPHLESVDKPVEETVRIAAQTGGPREARKPSRSPSPPSFRAKSRLDRNRQGSRPVRFHIARHGRRAIH